MTHASQIKSLDRPIRVLLLIDSFRMGGAERITVDLLPHFDRIRVTPMICTLHRRRESPLAEQIGDIPRFDLAAKRMLDLEAFRRLVRLCKSKKIDIIHAQLQDANIMAAAVHRWTGLPAVTTRHLIGDDAQNVRRRLRNRLEHVAVRYGMSRIIAVSNATRDSYSRLTGIRLSRFRTIYNGINLGRFAFAEDKHVKRASLGLPDDGPIITFVGVMRPGKGHEVAIDAARQLQGMHLLLVGDGKPPFRSQLEEQAKGLEDRVHFLGQRMDVPEILSASDVLILPSDSEALPTVLIEAGASGLPSIATTVGGCGEVIEHGSTGILIPPQDPQSLVEAVRGLVENPLLAEQMGKAAYKRVHSLFTLPGQAAALADLYEEVVCSLS